jgi:hypothetical protein
LKGGVVKRLGRRTADLSRRMSFCCVFLPKLLRANYFTPFNDANLIEFHQAYHVQQHRCNRSNSIKTDSFIQEVGQELFPFF